MGKDQKPNTNNENNGNTAVENRNERVRTISDEDLPIIYRLIGPTIFFGALYYFLIWNNIPGEDWIRWVVTGVLVLVVFFIYIISRAKTERFFKILSNQIFVVLIIFGAMIVSLLFAAEEQILLFKILAILYFSMLIPWLYLQFIVTKGKTLWDEYVNNLFRLRVDHYENLPEPAPQSVFHERWVHARRDLQPDELAADQDQSSIYEKKFEGLFGPVRHKDNIPISIFRGENIVPVAFATFLISVGWVLVVEPDSVMNLRFISSGAASQDDTLIPIETFRFAFLGAYFYILQMLIRRYFQNDLKTSAYINSIMRIVIVLTLVWVIDLVMDAKDVNVYQRNVTAFVIGVFPHVGWQLIQEFVKWPMKFVIPSLDKEFPLSDLDGLNIWYESRLLEEGIEDMQNLVTANLVDVLLNTRIPVERLVDWVDQSLLYLHLGKNEGRRERLRMFGIRTATDLEEAFHPNPQNTIGEDNNDNLDHYSKLEYLLNSNQSEPSVLRTILSTLRRESNYFHVREWKSFPEREFELKSEDAPWAVD